MLLSGAKVAQLAIRKLLDEIAPKVIPSENG